MGYLKNGSCFLTPPKEENVKEKMVRTMVVPLLLALMVILTACGGSPMDTTAGATPAAPTGVAGTALDGDYPDALPVYDQLLVGTLLLEEEMPLAVTAEQAQVLLPLWRMARTLRQGDTASQSEIDTILGRIQAAMSDEQSAAIREMCLTTAQVPTLVQEMGLGDSGPPPVGVIPGGKGFGPEARATLLAERIGSAAGQSLVDKLLGDRLLQMLEARAVGGTARPVQRGPVMPNQQQTSFSPLTMVKVALWMVVIVVATVLLRRRQVTSKVRLAFLVGGVLLFGFIFGLAPGLGVDPDPVLPVRGLLTAILVRHQFVLLIVVMPVIYLVLVLVSNKAICGWGCQLGLLQDLLHRVPLPKWKPPFWLSNTVRVIAFVTLIAGLVLSGLDWIGLIDPFQLFSFNFTLWIGLSSAVVLIASLFVYRPWCQFICPFGLLSWLVEQVSLFRPRINWEACKECKLCVKACPTQAMADFYDRKKVHADCFACGDCITACPREDALGWWTKSQAKGKQA